jgi:hypothetical protein
MQQWRKAPKHDISTDMGLSHPVHIRKYPGQPLDGLVVQAPSQVYFPITSAKPSPLFNHESQEWFEEYDFFWALDAWIITSED